jgi:hypothetical protein
VDRARIVAGVHDLLVLFGHVVLLARIRLDIEDLGVAMHRRRPEASAPHERGIAPAAAPEP